MSAEPRLIRALAAMKKAAACSLEGLAAHLEDEATAFGDICRLGRTCPRDTQAMTLGRAFEGYAVLFGRAARRLNAASAAVFELHVACTCAVSMFEWVGDHAVRFGYEVSAPIDD